METFCCITTSPSPAPMIEPTRLPTVTGISHQPSSQARMPRVAQVSANSRSRACVRSRHGAQRVADHVRGVPENRKFFAPGEQGIHGFYRTVSSKSITNTRSSDETRISVTSNYASSRL